MTKTIKESLQECCDEQDKLISMMRAFIDTVLDDFTMLSDRGISREVLRPLSTALENAQQKKDLLQECVDVGDFEHVDKVAFDKLHNEIIESCHQVSEVLTKEFVEGSR